MVVLLPLALPGGLSGDPVALPLRQADADAALLALGAGACCAALRTARSAALRVVLGLVALGLVGSRWRPARWPDSLPAAGCWWWPRRPDGRGGGGRRSCCWARWSWWSARPWWPRRRRARPSRR
ncbi:hypothetical protein ACFQZC_31140 [Streptacidiphilus monticola]